MPLRHDVCLHEVELALRDSGDGAMGRRGDGAMGRRGDGRCAVIVTVVFINFVVLQELAYQRESALKQTNEQLARKLRVQAKRLALLQGAAAVEE